MSYVSSRQRRINREVRESITRRVVDWVGQIVLATIIGVFVAFIFINWLSGCGERFPTADGGYVEGQCITPFNVYDGHRASQSSGEK